MAKTIILGVIAIALVLITSSLVAGAINSGQIGLNFSVSPPSAGGPKYFQYLYASALSQSDAQWYANHNVILAVGLDSVDPSFLTWVRTDNPATKLLAYWDIFYTYPAQGQFSADGIYAKLISLGAETAFLHSGTPISPTNRILRNSGILNAYLMNPGDPTYRQLISDQAVSLTTTGHLKYYNYQGSYYSSNNQLFDGIFMDDADGFWAGFLTDFGSPVEYCPTGVCNPSLWVTNMMGLWNAVHTAIPSKLTIPNAAGFHVLINGINNASGWSDEFAPCAGNGCTFGWDELQHMQDLTTITKNNPNTLALFHSGDVGYATSNGISLDRARLLDLSLYFIAGHSSNTYIHLIDFGYGSKPSTVPSAYNASLWSLYNMNLGKPLADTVETEGVYGHIFTRLFEKGIVISKYQRSGNGDADSTGETIQLGATYRNVLTGGNVTSILLRNGEAFIGLKPGVSLQSISALPVFSPLSILATLGVAAILLSRKKLEI